MASGQARWLPQTAAGSPRQPPELEHEMSFSVIGNSICSSVDEGFILPFLVRGFVGYFPQVKVFIKSCMMNQAKVLTEGRTRITFQEGDSGRGGMYQRCQCRALRGIPVVVHRTRDKS